MSPKRTRPASQTPAPPPEEDRAAQGQRPENSAAKAGQAPDPASAPHSAAAPTQDAPANGQGTPAPQDTPQPDPAPEQAKDAPQEKESRPGAATPAAPAAPAASAGPVGPDQPETLVTPAPAPRHGFCARRVAETFAAPEKKRGLGRKLLLAGLALLVISLAAAGYSAFALNAFLNTPAQAVQETVQAEIIRGDTFSKVASRLKKAGLISNALYFRLYAMWEGRTGSIQAGVFEFQTNWTPRQVLEHLVFGRPVLHRLTIREGLAWWEVAKLAEEGGFATAEDFKAIIHDADFLTKHNIPFSNAEGFLFPDTYFLRKPKEMNQEAALALAERLVGTFEQKTKTLFADQDMDADKLKRIIILASMVEKETSLEAERPTVAGVFANRLALNMLMQCDPTIIYGLGEKFNGNLRRRDLEDDSNPYNTYRHAGLPPGPICSPGYSAIAAATHPAEHDYLYFVATKAGGEHIFNTTLSAHNRAVNKYQRGGGQ